MEEGPSAKAPDLDEVLEGMMKNNEALKKHIEESSRKHSESSNSSFELEETTLEDRKKDVNDEEKTKDIDSKLKVFARESSRFKLIPDPEMRSGNEENFQRNIREAFERVLPDRMVESLSTKKCGLCNEQFEELKWAHRHYTGYNHKGAIKSFIRGTFQIHPPYFKMVWEAILSKDPEGGVTDIQIFVYVMQKFNVGEDIKKIEQFIQYGIERLLANDYISKEENMFKVVDASRALDIKAGAARVPANKVAATRDYKKDFETKILDEFQNDLPLEVLKTLKPDYCGLCHSEIKDSGWEKHYTGSSHKRIVELYKTGQYLGHPSYSKMMEQYFANENPKILSEKEIAKFIMKNFKVEADELKVHSKVQKVLKSILEKPDERSQYRESRYRDREESWRLDSSTSRHSRPQDRRRSYRQDRDRAYPPPPRTRSRSRERYSAQLSGYQQSYQGVGGAPPSHSFPAVGRDGGGGYREHREGRPDYRR